MIRKRRREHLDARARACSEGRRSRIWPTPPSRRPRWDELDDLRATALEQRIDADLALGRHADLIGELESLVAEYPLREHAWGQLMLAEYRSGRQGEALATFDHARHKLADELGIDPGQSLQQLHQQILRQDPACDCRQLRTRRSRSRPRPPETPFPRRGHALGRRRTRVLLAAAGVVAAAGIAAGLISARGSSRAPTVASETTANSVAVIDGRNGRLVADVNIGDSADAVVVRLRRDVGTNGRRYKADRHRDSQGHGHPRGRQLRRARGRRGMGVRGPRSCASTPIT